MKRLQRTAWAFPLGVLLVWGTLASAAASDRDTNMPKGAAARTAPLAVTLGEATRGVVFYTAAINSDGSIASCFECDPSQTVRLGVGIYQVNFLEDVTAANGWSRWVQPDTLTDGTINAWCTTANRAGLATGVWVQCQTSGGPGSQGNSKPVDASFFLFVAR